jgi:hypothetical protein
MANGFLQRMGSGIGGTCCAYILTAPSANTRLRRTRLRPADRGRESAVRRALILFSMEAPQLQNRLELYRTMNLDQWGAEVLWKTSQKVMRARSRILMWDEKR